VRLDSAIYAGLAIPVEYDPLLAKLAVWAGTREEAIARMSRAVSEYRIGGVHTNLEFFQRILVDPQFREGHLNTGFIPAFLARSSTPPADPEREALAAMVAVIHARSQTPDSLPSQPDSRWRAEGRDQLFR
jgi:acetyl-CoA carboxylase biotin carboxylase subunit